MKEDYRTASKKALDDTLSSATRYLLYLLSGLVLITLIWAYFSVIDLATISNGTVVSSTSTQVIQNLEGGIVKEILVNEGDIVKKGQVIVRLDDTLTAAAYKKEKAKMALLNIETIRLTAEARSKSSVHFDKNMKKDYPKLTSQAQELFTRNQHALAETIKNTEKSVELIKKELGLLRPLEKEGVVSTVERLRLERESNELKTRLAEKIEGIRNKARIDLNGVKAERALLQEQISASRDRLMRTSIRSPVHGVINKMNITTIGQVIESGMKIIEIVPISDKLTVETQIKPSDIGFIHVGQDATVKISAYDYSVYGDVKAKVTSISADAIIDARGNPFYKVKLKTEHNYLGNKADNLPIIPGMTATVTILTGKRSLLNYLLKPIITLKSSAYTAR